MKRKETPSLLPQSAKFIVAFIIQVFMAGAVRAQALPSTAAPTPVVAASTPALASSVAEPDSIPHRLERARALAAAHQLAPAATELESLRASVKDEVVRGNASLMLMGIYLEDGTYSRAEALLEETFKARSAKNEASVRTYFALAGQAVNGARTHVGRYRTFGIDVSSANLPAEAAADLDRLRSLLERMSAQGRELIKENAKANDAFALLEDISGIRTTLARDTTDRAKWDTERSAARARMAILPAETAPISNVPATSDTDSETRNAHTANPGQPVTEQRAAAPNAIVSAGLTGTTTAEAIKPVNPNAAIEAGSLTEKAITKVMPVYPQMARNSGISGLVRIKIVIDESGSVASIVWAEGPMLLRQAAQDALRQWKFQPVVMDGKPVKATGYVDFGFSR